MPHHWQQARLLQRSGGKPPSQTTGDLDTLYAQNTAIAGRVAMLAVTVAQKSGCKAFTAAPQKSPVRVVEKVSNPDALCMLGTT